jgi:hypothetical protein
MKRLLAGFLALAIAMVLSVGNTGCTKKPETKDKVVEKDKVEKDKKADTVMTPKPAPGKESGTLEDGPKTKELPTPPPPPIPLPPKDEPKKEEPKKATDAPKDLPKVDPPKVDLPKLDLPKDEPKKGASLDRPLRSGREAILDAAFERRTASS